MAFASSVQGSLAFTFAANGMSFIRAPLSFARCAVSTLTPVFTAGNAGATDPETSTTTAKRPGTEAAATDRITNGTLRPSTFTPKSLGSRPVSGEPAPSSTQTSMITNGSAVVDTLPM